MSELIKQNDNRATIHWKLLTGVSALALTAYVSAADVAKAEDTSQPPIWIELGGQLEQMNDAWEPFAPRFVSNIDTSSFPSPIKAQKPPPSAISANGKITFQPDDSDWVFSAALRFGRSGSKRQVHGQTNPGSAVEILSVPLLGLYGKSFEKPRGRKFVDAYSRHNEKHEVLDFQAGKDVGLGLFGGNGSSVVSAGVRYAQFASSSSTRIGADPDFHFSYKYATGFGPFPSAHIKAPHQTWHDYAAHANISRSFRGIGPSLKWEASAPFAGSKDSSELTFDWGVNAALLFGRQRVRSQHDTQALLRHANFGSPTTVAPYPHRYYNPAPRSKSVTVPNVGGFAGLSFRYPNAKISVGYRADFFFGAIDGGIDVHKAENRGFYGPYASISIGIGGE